MMANYEIGKFIATMQHLTNLQLSSKSVCTDALSKQRNEKKILVTFLFLISKLKGFEF